MRPAAEPDQECLHFSEGFSKRYLFYSDDYYDCFATVLQQSLANQLSYQ
jgi:hypothetical protein